MDRRRDRALPPAASTCSATRRICTPKTPGYFVVNLNTQLSGDPNVQLFGLVENVSNYQILHIRHVLADVLGVPRAGAGRDQPAQLQPERAGRGIWRIARHVLKIRQTVDRGHVFGRPLGCKRFLKESATVRLRSCFRPVGAAHRRWPRWVSRPVPKRHSGLGWPCDPAGCAGRRIDRSPSSPHCPPAPGIGAPVRLAPTSGFAR